MDVATPEKDNLCTKLKRGSVANGAFIASCKVSAVHKLQAAPANCSVRQSQLTGCYADDNSAARTDSTQDILNAAVPPGGQTLKGLFLL